MTLVEINKGRGLTLPAAVRRKYSLKPGSRLELKDKNGEIVLMPLAGKQEDVFKLIDGQTKAISDKGLQIIKKRVREHAFVH